MTGKQARTHRGPRIWATVGLALLVIAVILITVGLVRGPSPPQPAEDAGRSAPVETSGSAADESPTTSPDSDDKTSMDASVPTQLSIPAIDVDTDIMKLGLTDSGELEVPPLGKDAPAGWYERSPTPGEIGPSLIVGHVDSAAEGPAVFFDLGALHKGDKVSVTREDDSTATFAVDAVTDYGKDSFPEYKVYGNTEDPEIRLITCGGDFDKQTGHYEDNIVVTAHLINDRG